MYKQGDSVVIIKSNIKGIIRSIDEINGNVLYTVEARLLENHIANHELFPLGKLMVSCREDEIRHI